MLREVSGRVVVYLSSTGKPLRRAHQRILLEEDAKTIAAVKRCEFAGYYRNELAGTGSLFFVPDQTLLVEEEMFTTSAESRFPAISNDVRVRVDASKKRLMTVFPRSVGTFLMGLVETS